MLNPNISFSEDFLTRFTPKNLFKFSSSSDDKYSLPTLDVNDLYIFFNSFENLFPALPSIKYKIK